LQKVDPPQQVIDSLRDVQAARIDQERAQNEAQTYANRVVPEARGRASQITQAAEAYQKQTVAEARGQTARFLSVYEEYKKAPEVTRQRLYLETSVALWIEPDGRIARWRQERSSGNATFDAAVERTLKAAPRLPPPPDPLRRTGILLVFRARDT